MKRSRQQSKNGSIFMERNKLKKLEKNWTNGFAAYGSKKNLKLATNLSDDDINKFLHSKNSYTKFYVPKRSRFDRLPVKAFDINEIWCMDVAYMDKIALPNDGIKFLLVCVDVLSRFLRVEPMKSLSSQQAKEALVRMINKSNATPQKIWTDQGKEFEGDFKKFCLSMEITKYHTNTGTKATLAERAIRSLKAIIVRYLEEKWLWRYIDQLPNFVDIINSRVNRGLGMAPKDISKKHTLQLIAKQDSHPEKPLRFDVGDNVRLASKDTPFRKGYRQQFTNEVFIIHKIFSNNPPSYILFDMNGEEILGKFYEPEMIRVTK